MSLECVELWRPRRERARRARRALGALLGLVVLGGSIAAALKTGDRVVLVAGIVTSPALACLFGRGAAGPPAWVPRLPRRWVPRPRDDRRRHTEFDRRKPRAARPRPESCNPHASSDAVAMEGRRPL
ncbi:MAG TPA: hypothetical protein VI792_09150 [Candidatus Eisenbacteria bacterium]